MPQSNASTEDSNIVPYKQDEAVEVQAKLNRRLGPEFLAYRPGPNGGQQAYLTGERVVGLANEIFGFNGWSSDIKEVVLDFVYMQPPFSCWVD
jgi:DNA recombination protein Rad52